MSNGNPMTLEQLIAKHGSLDKIPNDELFAAGYERKTVGASNTGSYTVKIRRIGAPDPQPVAPKRAAHGRVMPTRQWGYGPGLPGPRRPNRG